MKIDRNLPLPGSALSAEERLQKQDQNLREAAEMYEQHFMREMVKAMRQATPEAGLIPQNMGEKIFSEQLDNQRVEQWSKSGGVGLADMIYQHVKERYLNKP
jgi:peptidoglycan hydrolase FlgJ